MQVGIDHPGAKKLWNHKSISTLRKNRKLCKTIVQSMRRVDVRSKQGIYLGRRTAFLFPVKVYEEVMERTIRGLYYYHFWGDLGISCALRGQFSPIATPRVYRSIHKLASISYGIGGCDL
jgi:hypothetical protein